MTTTTNTRTARLRTRVLPDTRTWIERAACTGVEVEAFYAEDPTTQRETIGAYCATCPVQQPCLEDAITEETTLTGGPVTQAYGIRGGHTPQQRQRLHLARRRGENPDTNTPQCNIPTRPKKNTPPKTPPPPPHAPKTAAQAPRVIEEAPTPVAIAEAPAPGAVTTGPFWLVDCAECGTTIGHSCDTKTAADKIRDTHNTALHPTNTKEAPRCA